MYLNAPARGLSAWPSFLTGYDTDQLQKESAALDAQLQKVNDEARAKGTIDEATYQTTIAHLTEQIRATENIPADVDEAWVEGALEGYKNDLAILNSIPKYAGKVAGDVLHAIITGIGSGGVDLVKKAIPWWLWAVAAGALFIYLGGGKVLDFQARKRISRYAR